MKTGKPNFYLNLILACSLAIGALTQLDAQVCGNNTPGGPAGTPQNPGGDSFDAYTGNDVREVDDLVVWGGVGEHQLKFTRYGVSRFLNQSSYFGLGHAWRHNYQWLMHISGSSLSVSYPDGTVNIFSQTSPSHWTSTASVTDNIYQTGPIYKLQQKNGSRYVFFDIGGGVGQLQSFSDSKGSAYGLTYASPYRVSRITEPGGRYLQLTYTTLSVNRVDFTNIATVPSAPSDGTWVTLTVTNTTPFRYLRYRGPDGGYCDVSEIQFYDTSGHLLTGTAIGGGDPATSGTGYAKAVDGSTSTYFDSSEPTGSFTGIDLGVGNATVIGSVKYLCRTGYGSRMYLSSSKPGHFEGSNDAPQTVQVISQVASSDGRSVTYNYSPFSDPTIPYLYQDLTSVSYGDSTTATYSYAQVLPATQPLLVAASDPRYTAKSAFVQVKTSYTTGVTEVLGFIQSKTDYTDNHLLAGLGTPSSYYDAAPVTYPGSRTVQYGVNHTSGQHTSVTDAAGHSVAIGYDQAGGTAGFEISRTDQVGHIWLQTPTIYNNPTSMTAPNGDTESLTRDDLDLPLTYTDARGHTTTYTRDANHRVTRIDYPDSTYETCTYNSFNEVLTHRFRNGGSESYTYGTSGLVTSRTDALSHTWSYTYDTHDRVASATDPNSHTTSFQYNERGLVTQVTYADSTTTSYTYDGFGNCTSMTNELGKTWTYTYNNYRQMTSMTDPLSRTTNYTFNTPYTKEPDQVALPTGKVLSRTFDSKFRKLTETVGYSTADAATTTWTYDNVDNITSITDPRGKVTHYTYDNKNRKLNETDPLGHTTSYTYDANNNVLTVTRPDSGVTTNVYDVMNRLTQSTDPKGQVTTYTYDSADNMLTMTDPRSHTYTYAYDLLNRRTSLTYPDSSVESSTYDAAGNMATYTTRASQVKTSTYDSRNRETAYTWSDSTPGVTRTYDNAGRLLTSANGISTSTYTYDNANELLTDSQNISGSAGAQTITYTYNNDGNRATATYPNGTVVTYSYTNRNQVSSIASTIRTSQQASYTYDADGNVIARSLDNGTSTACTYDDASRLTQLQQNGPSSTTFETLNYTYNNVNDRTNKKTTNATYTSGVYEVSSYDAIDQVTETKYNATASSGTGATRDVSYSLDATGDRTSVTDGSATSYTVNNLNQYTAVGGTTYGYDSNGNLTSGPGTYSYDAQNRLVSATVGGVTTTLAYDSKSRCVSRTVSSTTTYYIYDSWNLIGEYIGTFTTPSQTYVHGIAPDEITAKKDSGGTVVYYCTDGLGSITYLTDTSGAIAEHYTYDIYGAATMYDGSGTLLSSSAYANRFLFTGREFISQINAYDYRNRIYSADLGRFLQTDPILFSAGDTNIYRYCGNNPLNASDPSGMASTWKGDDGWKGASVDGKAPFYCTINPCTGNPAAGWYIKTNALYTGGWTYEMYSDAGPNDSGSTTISTAAPAPQNTPPPSAPWLTEDNYFDRVQQLLSGISIVGGLFDGMGEAAALKAISPAVRNAMYKGGIEDIAMAEREAAAKYYDQIAQNTENALVKAFNEARAVYARNGGTPPGGITNFGK